MEVFKTLSAIDVNSKTEKKGKFTYLSWAFAWAELKKVAPTASAKVYHDENTNMPYFASKAGVIVKVGITVEGLEHINYLPVMDFRNAAIPAEKVTMMDVNKAIQRCTVKAIALHGLGLYIYAGEDLPEEPTKEPEQEPEQVEDRKVALKDSQLKSVLLSKDKKHAKYFLDNFRMADDERTQLKAIL
tara:strand:- start:483 stop:1043 length:561 start_codon:yes stop_codon:yes gene_type:complete